MARGFDDWHLIFLVRDGAGAVHRVRTRTSSGTFPTIRRFKLREWSLWNQVESICLRPPAPAEEPVCTSDVGRLAFTTHGYLISDEIAVLTSPEPLAEIPPARPHGREYYDNVFDRRDQYQKMIAPGNLILGKTLRYSPTPTQYLNIDDDDPQQLTDGKLGVRVDERVWFERGCVGWQGPPLMNIFADLGQAKPVGSAVIRLLGGNEQGSLNFPDEIKVLLSNDGKAYYEAASRHKRGLDDLSETAYGLPEEKLAWVHNFQLHVGRRARYVVVQILHQKQFAVSDEMAIVKGPDDLPDFEPEPSKKVVIVTSGVAFPPVWGKVSVCRNMPLRARLAIQDARPGAGRKKPCKLVLDLPETLRFVTEGYTPTEVKHEGRMFSRYVINWRGLGTDFYLQSLLLARKTDVRRPSRSSPAGSWDTPVRPTAASTTGRSMTALPDTRCG